MRRTTTAVLWNQTSRLAMFACAVIFVLVACRSGDDPTTVGGEKLAKPASAGAPSGPTEDLSPAQPGPQPAASPRKTVQAELPRAAPAPVRAPPKLNPVLLLGLEMARQTPSTDHLAELLALLVEGGLSDEAETFVAAFDPQFSGTAKAILALTMAKAGSAGAGALVEDAVRQLRGATLADPCSTYLGFYVPILLEAGATCDQILSLVEALAGCASPNDGWLVSAGRAALDAGNKACASRVLEKVGPVILARVQTPSEDDSGDSVASAALGLVELTAGLGQTEEALRIARLMEAVCDSRGCDGNYLSPEAYVEEALAAQGDDEGACRLCGGCGRCAPGVAAALVKAGKLETATATANGQTQPEARAIAFLALARGLVNAGRCPEAANALSVVAGLTPKLDSEEEADPGTRLGRTEAEEGVVAAYLDCGMVEEARKVGYYPKLFQEAEARTAAKQGGTKGLIRFLRSASWMNARRIAIQGLIAEALKARKADQALEWAGQLAPGPLQALELVRIGTALHRVGTLSPSGSEALLSSMRSAPRDRPDAEWHQAILTVRSLVCDEYKKVEPYDFSCGMHAVGLPPDREFGPILHGSFSASGREETLVVVLGGRGYDVFLYDGGSGAASARVVDSSEWTAGSVEFLGILPRSAGPQAVLAHIETCGEATCQEALVLGGMVDSRDWITKTVLYMNGCYPEDDSNWDSCTSDLWKRGALQDLDGDGVTDVAVTLLRRTGAVRSGEFKPSSEETLTFRFIWDGVDLKPHPENPPSP